MQRASNRFALVCAIVGIAPLASSALAAPSHTWTGAGNNNVLSTATNWSDNVAPLNGSTYATGSLEQLIDNSTVSPTTLYVGNSAVNFATLTINSPTLQTIDGTPAAASGNRFFVMTSTATPTLALGSNVGAGDTPQTITIANGSSSGVLMLVQFKSDGIIDVANAGATLNMAAAVQGAFNIEKTGAGTLLLSNTDTTNNSFGANKTLKITGGTVSAAATANFGSSSNSITLNGGTLQLTPAATLSLARTINILSPGGTIDLVGAQTTNDVTLTSVLSGSNNFTKSGKPRLILSPASVSTYNGTITVKSGVVQVKPTSVASGATYKLDGTTDDNPVIELRNATANNFGNNFQVTTFGQINSGGGAVQHTVGDITLSAGATVKVSGSSSGTLAANSIILNGAGTAQVNANLALGGITDSTGTSSFTKTDVATLTLSGIGAQGGATVVSNGTLKLGASATLPNTPSVEVGTSGTFDVSAISNFSLGSKSLLGSGKIVGDFSAGGAIDPATRGTTGKLWVDGALTLAADSVSTFDILSAGSFDQLAQLNSGKAVSMAGSIVAAFNGTFDGTETFQILDFSQYSGTPAFSYTGLDPAAMTASFDPQTGIVALSAVPEPASIGVLALGGLALLRRRRA